MSRKALNQPKAAELPLSCQHLLSSFYGQFCFNGAESFQTCCSFKPSQENFWRFYFATLLRRNCNLIWEENATPNPPKTYSCDHRMQRNSLFFTPSLLLLVIYLKCVAEKPFTCTFFKLSCKKSLSVYERVDTISTRSSPKQPQNLCYYSWAASREWQEEHRQERPRRGRARTAPGHNPQTVYALSNEVCPTWHPDVSVQKNSLSSCRLVGNQMRFRRTCRVEVCIDRRRKTYNHQGAE